MLPTSKHHVSPVRPLEDETLVAFFQRAQADGGLTDDDFQTKIAPAPFQDAWLAERRWFDWVSVSRFVNATPAELHSMSQRSLFHSLEDESHGCDIKQRAPWLGRTGYSAHCPCCVRESPHWRKSWLNPTAIVCEKHETVLVRHCDLCGMALDSLNWTQVRPICPSCHNHLSLSPVIAAPEELIVEAKKLGQRFESMLRRAPLPKSDFDRAHFDAVWRAAELLNLESNGLEPVRAKILELRGIKTLSEDRVIARRAMRWAESIVVAHLLAEIEPSFSEHFWLSVTNRGAIKRADSEVLAKLRQIARHLSITLDEAKAVDHQLTMSFEIWHGSNGMPRAA